MRRPNPLIRMARCAALGCIGTALFAAGTTASAHEVKDLKYGAILFEFYQQKYFETLVEYDYAAEKGGVEHHGTYPELLKGGVSLSYGLDVQAKDIFSALIEQHSAEDVRNRAWFYLSKMRYLRGDIPGSATTLSNIEGTLPEDIEQEYRYLGALINIKLGHFDVAEGISRSFDRDSAYAPYLYFNLGVAQGRQQDYTRAAANLQKAASYAGKDDRLSRLADRAQMAIAYLLAEEGNFAGAYERIDRVSTTGVFSNRALLGSGWASVNNGAYRQALAPLQVLQQRSMAIPEVQEAVLLVPHVYEKLELPGRAARGFISAYDRYSEALAELDRAREALDDADVLELFVRNMDELLGESDWFGTAPSVSLNALSPFMLELMADHSFQSVLKDLRDLYAIRNNLGNWERKRDDFAVILASRSAQLDTGPLRQQSDRHSRRVRELQETYRALSVRVASLPAADRERVQWLLDDLHFDLASGDSMVSQLRDASGVSTDAEHFSQRVTASMEELRDEIERTNRLIGKVEDVMRELVRAELDLHEERLKYYRVQSHLAKVRILDRSLTELDRQADVEGAGGAPDEPEPPDAAATKQTEGRGGDDAA